MKHIIAIIDGTWVSAANSENPFSNAYNLNWLLDSRAEDGNEQIVLYTSGIGSDKSAGPFLSGATARGIDHQTREAYINICSNFKRTDANGLPDKIYLYGFSRGAVVARALAALISVFGILRPSHMNYFPALWKRFVAGQVLPEGKLQNVLYRDVDVQMIGLFDCVFGVRDRTGRFHTLRFPDYHVPSKVRAAVHLLSLDDTRLAFSPMLWDGGNCPNVEQIWMPGVHSDIGGTFKENRLGKIALMTMLDRISAYTSLRFHPDSIAQFMRFNGDLVVNNECSGLWRFAIRAPRRYLEKGVGQYLHPLVREVEDNVEIRYKGRPLVYRLHTGFGRKVLDVPVFEKFKHQHSWSEYAGLSAS